ncbi:MAG TPA: UDP-N-acetylmuramoyl-L-alanyl-D-glutamate--2,6-diaminopimelate ligase, partial [Candidatus Limnocylindrales bacterium]
RRDGLPIGAAGLADIAVRGVTDDSRAVREGMLFVALPGFHVDGTDYVRAAAEAGAAAAIVDHAVPDVPLPQLVVASPRAALAGAACWWYGDPSREIGTIGITGTDGKTTTSFLAAAALEAAGLSTGLVGTVETRIGDVRDRHAAHVTTPGAPELQAVLRAMVRAGNQVAVLETTSHALELDRVLGVAWDAAVFTNLTHEHLDLHGTFEAYRAAKLRLFHALGAGDGGGNEEDADAATNAANPIKTVGGRPWPKVAIVNRDDEAASWFEAAAHAAGARVVTYGGDASADVRATAIEEDARRLRVAFDAPSGSATVELRLAGRFNVHNALAVVALGEALALDPVAVRHGLASVEGVPGRMERIDQGQPFAVIVDYAHTPASLGGVLDLLAPVAAAGGGGLIAVFGSGGERDTAKRGAMGRIAAERCRLVIATDEDPRGEDRDAIIYAIVRGAESGGGRRGVDVLAIADRREAIAAAFERAQPGDIVLLAGKGHEASILYADGPIDWDEAAEARRALASLGYPGA